MCAVKAARIRGHLFPGVFILTAETVELFYTAFRQNVLESLEVTKGVL